MNAEVIVVIVVCSLALVFAIKSSLGKLGLLIGQKKPDCGCGSCAAKRPVRSHRASPTAIQPKEKTK